MEHRDIPDFGLPEKEEKILKSAIKIFSEKGFSASTTSEIAKRRRSGGRNHLQIF